MNDSPSPPKRRKTENVMKISASRFATTKKIVSHYAAIIGDGSVSFHTMKMDGRENVEPFTFFVRKAINNHSSDELLRAGFCLCVNISAERESNEPLRNSRGYQVMGFIALTDDGEPMTVNTLKAKTEVLINVSTLQPRFRALIYL